MAEGNREPIYFGSDKSEFTALRLVNRISQVRQQYDPEGIEDLATAIVTDASVFEHPELATSGSFDLQNPLSLGRHDRSSLNRYMREHGDYYEIPRKDQEATKEGLVRDDKGRTHISVTGHRRSLALELLVDRVKLKDRETYVWSRIEDNITFDQALAIQLRENVHDRPPAEDEARAIGRFYRSLITADGERPSIKKIAAQIGFRETKVRDALAFDSLPASIQALTFSGTLPYTVVRRLAPLMTAFDHYHKLRSPNLDDAARAIAVEDDLRTFCDQMLHDELKGMTEVRRAKRIENRVLEVLDEANYEPLFTIDRSSPAERRQTSSIQLASLALKVLVLKISRNELPLEKREEILAAFAEMQRLESERQAAMLEGLETFADDGLFDAAG